MRFRLFVLVGLIVFSLASFAHAREGIRFGVPPWPGVTVKTEVITQIVETMGYKTDQAEIGPPVIYKGMQSGDVDAFLATWTPAQNGMLKPAVASGKVEIAGTNLDEASLGMCVPKYVWDAGVHSFAELAPNAGKFGKKIYNIEVGSGIHTEMSAAIENNVANLGDWEHVASTTPIMLSQVQDAIKNNDWVIFSCWRPHWMNIVIDMAYLESVPGMEKVVSESTVFTTVRRGFGDENPNVYRLLKQFKIAGATQSQWIYDFAHDEKAPEDVASQWIKNNLDEVAVWLEGVNAKNGKPAIDVVRAAYK